MAFPEKQWSEAKRLYEVNGFSQSEIALKTGIKHSTIREKAWLEKWKKAEKPTKKTTKMDDTIIDFYKSNDPEKIIAGLEKIPELTPEQIKQFLTQIVLDQKTSTKDRLKAIELLAKIKQMLINKNELDIKGNLTISLVKFA